MEHMAHCGVNSDCTIREYCCAIVTRSIDTESFVWVMS